jgi:hypothetical protein
MWVLFIMVVNAVGGSKGIGFVTGLLGIVACHAVLGKITKYFSTKVAMAIQVVRS